MDNVEYYIEDNDLVDLLKSVLGDQITDEDIEKILAASEDGCITEDDFDRAITRFIETRKGSERRPIGFVQK